MLLKTQSGMALLLLTIAMVGSKHLPGVDVNIDIDSKSEQLPMVDVNIDVLSEQLPMVDVNVNVDIDTAGRNCSNDGWL